MSKSSDQDTAFYDAEAAEVARMKEECLEMIHDAFEKIDVMLSKIDSILAREEALTGSNGIL